jgi:hypothetical protein
VLLSCGRPTNAVINQTPLVNITTDAASRTNRTMRSHTREELSCGTGEPDRFSRHHVNYARCYDCMRKKRPHASAGSLGTFESIARLSRALTVDSLVWAADWSGPLIGLGR